MNHLDIAISDETRSDETRSDETRSDETRSDETFPLESRFASSSSVSSVSSGERQTAASRRTQLVLASVLAASVGIESITGPVWTTEIESFDELGTARVGSSPQLDRAEIAERVPEVSVRVMEAALTDIDVGVVDSEFADVDCVVEPFIGDLGSGGCSRAGLRACAW